MDAVKGQGQPDRVRYGHGRTINLGNFNSLRFDVELASDIRPGETFEGAMDRVRMAVLEQVDEEEARWNRR